MKNTVMPRWVFWMCLCAVVIVPVANDICVPAFPVMQHLFNTSHINWVLSAYLLGLAIGQFVYGPLSDRFGRKPILLLGLCVYLLGCVFSLTTSSFQCFLLARFVQAIGACSVIISAFAMIRDCFSKDNLSQPMGVVMAIIGISPTIAPLFGSVLLTHYGWRSTFVFQLILGLVFVIMIAIFCRETQAKNHRQSLRVATIGRNYAALLRNPLFLYPCLLSAIVYGILFSYISLAPAYIIGLFHGDVMTVGWVILLMGLILFVMSLVVPQMLVKKGESFVMIMGCACLMLGAVAMVVSLLLWHQQVVSFIVPMGVIMVGIGSIRACISMVAMKRVDRSLSGSAASVFNGMTFIGGCVFSSLSIFIVHFPVCFGLCSLVLSAVAWLLVNEISGQAVLSVDAGVSVA